MSHCGVPRICAVDSCSTRIGLNSTYCDDHEYPAGRLSGQCRVCAALVQNRAKPSDFICGPACRAVHDRREAVKESAKPGDPYYTPSNDTQLNLHKKETRKRNQRNGSP